MMRRILLAALLVTIMALFGAAALADETADFAWTLEDGTLTLSGIGDTPIYDFEMTPWYDSRDEIVHAVIEEGLTSVGKNLFAQCGNLQSVSLPEGLLHIGSYAFSGCGALTDIVLPEGLTDIGFAAFSSCAALTSLTIPQSVTLIRTLSFARCDGLSQVTVFNPDVVFERNDESYEHPFSQRNGVELTFFGLPGSTTETFAARYGYGFEYITLGEGRCGENVTWKKDASGLLKVSGEGPMWDYETSVSPFGGDADIARVVIERGVTTIGAGAFSGCANLSEVTLYNAGIAIGENALPASSGLTLYGHAGSTAAAYADAHGIPFALIEYPSGQCGDGVYWTMDDTGLLTISGSGPMWGYPLNDGMDTQSPFRKNSNVRKVVIQDGVTSVGRKAFYGCVNMTEVTLPGTLLLLGEESFYDCASLQRVIIPEGVTLLGISAFEHCVSLTEAVVPASVEDIRGAVFKNCISLSDVTLTDGLTCVGYEMFAGCSSLTSVTIPESVTEIKTYAFADCENLMQLTLRGAFTRFGSNGIFGDESTGLYEAYTRVTLYGWPDSTADEYADAHAMRIVYLPEEYLVLPAGLTRIEEEAFVGIRARRVVIPPTVTEIAGNPFADSRVVYIYGYANSTAQAFALAREEDFIFVEIDDEWMAAH